MRHHFAGKNSDEPLVMFGDIAVPTGLQNADPCTRTGCTWPKATDGNVYVPYRISRDYCKCQPTSPRIALILVLLTVVVLVLDVRNCISYKYWYKLMINKSVSKLKHKSSF